MFRWFRENPVDGIIIGTILLMCLSFLSNQAYGYEETETGRHWQGTGITTYYNDSDCPNFSLKGVGEAVLNRWQVLPVTDLGVWSQTPGYDQRPTMFCAEDFPAELRKLPDNVEVVTTNLRLQQGDSYLVFAAAREYFIDDKTLDCDIRFHPIFVTEGILTEIALHEWGHCLGIPHSDTRDAIMWPSLRFQPTIGADDRMATCNLYGKCYHLLGEDLSWGVPYIRYEGKCYQGHLRENDEWPLELQNFKEIECDRR